MIDAVLVQNCGSPKASEQGNWYFGQYAGIRFTSNNSVVISDKALKATPNPTINSDEGCISQSTSDGRLLFYGGGYTELYANTVPLNDSFYVYDKTHQLMPHGVLMGSTSSMQGGIVIPHPESRSKFFLICVSHVFPKGQWDSSRGMRWSMIDTFLNGGKGDVVSTLKNVPVRVPIGIEKVNKYDSAVNTGEGIASIPHCDGKRHWIITGSGNDFGSKRVHVFISDTNGILYHHSDSMPTAKHTLFTVSASRDGNFVCISGKIFSFDRSVGRLKFLKDLAIPNFDFYYSEFSPSSNVLYTIPIYDDTLPYLFQTDLRSSDMKTTNFSIKPNNRMLQLGADNKIYIAQYDEGYLSVIENPDLINNQSNLNACGYKQDAISLNPNGTTMLRK
jgi:hypothetical protein